MPPGLQVTGSVRGKARLQVDAGLTLGDFDIAVGTHALISTSTQFKRLGLVVVDEQHKCVSKCAAVLNCRSCAHCLPRSPCHASRFGVAQRGRLLAKAAPARAAPHVLHMSATPIPRTQALIEHGDMTQVLIHELPPGRTPVQTRMLRDNSSERQHVRRLAARRAMFTSVGLCAVHAAAGPRCNQVPQMYQHIRQEIAAGHRAYIVCPFVDASDTQVITAV